MTAFEKAAELGIRVHPAMPIGRVRAAIRLELLGRELSALDPKTYDLKRIWEARTKATLPIPKANGHKGPRGRKINGYKRRGGR